MHCMTQFPHPNVSGGVGSNPFMSNMIKQREFRLPWDNPRWAFPIGSQSSWLISGPGKPTAVKETTGTIYIYNVL